MLRPCRSRSESRASNVCEGPGSVKIELNRDWNEFLCALIARRVRFVLVGGHAVAGHGQARLTEDLDVFVEPTLANATRLRDALVDFGFGAVVPSIADLAKPDRVLMLGHKPWRIDILRDRRRFVPRSVGDTSDCRIRPITALRDRQKRTTQEQASRRPRQGSPRRGSSRRSQPDRPSGDRPSAGRSVLFAGREDPGFKSRSVLRAPELRPLLP